MSDLQKYLQKITELLNLGQLIRVLLSDYHGPNDGLKKIRIEPVLLKGQIRLKWTQSFPTKDLIANHDIDSSISQLELDCHFNAFRNIQIYTAEADYTGSWKAANNFITRKTRPSLKHSANLLHDKEKKRTMEPNRAFLMHLNITDASGSVFKHAQDKYKQINHFIELLKPAVTCLPKDKVLRGFDMGCGKGYLTFALYQYLMEQQYQIQLEGIELRPELTAQGNKIAKACGFEQLHFREGNISALSDQPIDLLVALHACDTATDDAIAKGIINGASIIVVAPCCHKQIRKTLETSGGMPSRKALTRFGIFMDREAEMLTDALRALVLECYGYKVKVQEFISDAHTPKNVMILATKIRQEFNKNALDTFKKLKMDSGISFHHLETLLPELN